MYDYYCGKCGGLVPEPMKAYGYAGRYCSCATPTHPLEAKITIPNTTTHPMKTLKTVEETIKPYCVGVDQQNRKWIEDKDAVIMLTQHTQDIIEMVEGMKMTSPYQGEYPDGYNRACDDIQAKLRETLSEAKE